MMKFNLHLRRFISVGILLLLGFLLASGGATVLAQTSGEVVPAADCTIEPLTEGRLVSIVTDSTESQATPDAQTASDAKLSPEDVSAITAVIRMSIACANANAPMRSYALASNRYLHERFSGEGEDDLGHLLAANTRTLAPAPEEDQLALISIDDETLLADGRISVTVVTSNREVTFVDRILLAKDGVNWKIDEFVRSESSGTPVADT